MATSGDTGKAALEGFRDVSRTKIMVFYRTRAYPNIQSMQMQTDQDEGYNATRVAAVSGNFDDDSQAGVKDHLLRPGPCGLSGRKGVFSLLGQFDQ